MTAFSKMKVATKLTLGFGMIVVLMLLSGALAYRALSAVNARMNDVIEDKVVKLNWTAEINYHVLDIARALRNALLEADNAEKMETQIGHVLEIRAKIKAVVEQLEPRIVAPEGKTIFKRILEARANFIKGQDTVISMLREGKRDEARNYLLTEMRQYQAAYARATTELQDFQKGLMEMSSKAAHEEATTALNLILIAAFIGLLLAILIARQIVKNISHQLGGEPGDAAAVAASVAAGDLSHDIELRKGDTTSLMASLRTMQTGLATLVAEIEQMVAAAARGDFSSRIGLEGKQGFGLEIGQRLNLLAETTQTGLTDIQRVSQALAKGDLSQRIEKDYPGVFGETGAAVNETVRALKAIVEDIDGLVQGASQGDFSTRIDLDGRQGFALELSRMLNEMSVTIDSSLQDVMRVSTALAQGDLRQKVEQDYPGIFGRLKDDTNLSIDRLKEVVLRIKDATEAINTAAKEIAAGNQDLSSRTEEQASSLEETASSMEELNATVKQNAESARQANELSTSSNEIAVRGGHMVKQVVETMTGIQTSSQKIADIIGVIDSIAFQTNILALNAAVEAARAGEQGRGFAVVATEVRNLAQRSATAAKEIKLLIGESVDKVESGARLVNEAGATMDEVVASFQRVAHLVTDITNASREQSSGIEQVTQAVSQMDEVTQQNAALVEEAAAAAESLEEQASGLVQAVGMFKLQEGAANLPGPALRDATPKQLAGKPSMARLERPAAVAKSSKQTPPAHLSDTEEEWEEF